MRVANFKNWGSAQDALAQNEGTEYETRTSGSP